MESGDRESRASVEHGEGGNRKRERQLGKLKSDAKPVSSGAAAVLLSIQEVVDGPLSAVRPNRLPRNTHYHVTKKIRPTSGEK